MEEQFVNTYTHIQQEVEQNHAHTYIHMYINNSVQKTGNINLRYTVAARDYSLFDYPRIVIIMQCHRRSPQVQGDLDIPIRVMVILEETIYMAWKDTNR